MNCILHSIALCLVSTVALGQAVARPLDVAVTSAKGKFQGYVYKAKGVAKSIDCTEFVLAVVNDLTKSCGKKLSAKQRTTLVVAGVKAAELQGLVGAGDKSIRGVQQALIDAGLGKAVNPQDAAPGDLVQYWYKTKSGKWAGHAGLIERVTKDAAKKTTTLTIFGSHKSTLRKRADGAKDTKAGGIGSGPRLVLPRDTLKVFVVRWTAKVVASGGRKKPSK